MANFIKHHQKDFVARPLLQEQMSDVVGYDRPFPSYDDVTAPAHYGPEQPRIQT